MSREPVPQGRNNGEEGDQLGSTIHSKTWVTEKLLLINSKKRVTSVLAFVPDIVLYVRNFLKCLSSEKWSNICRLRHRYYNVFGRWFDLISLIFIFWGCLMLKKTISKESFNLCKTQIIYFVCPFAVYYLRYAVRSFFTMYRISLADGKRAGCKVQLEITVAVQKVKSPLLFVPLFWNPRKILSRIILVVLVIKLTKERRRRVSRGRD